MKKEKIPIIAIVGATAVGKTKLSIDIAKKFNCEIISVDSVQIYKKFDIGSAKITKEEMSGVKHHLIDILSPNDTFSVYDFQKIARKKIEEVYNKGKIPLLIGGSGYYMSAVLYDYKFAENSNIDKNISIENMINYIKSNYPDTYNTLDINNNRRIVNAYNYVFKEQKSITENKGNSTIYDIYNPYIIVLNKDREELYNNINNRVDTMINNGLIEEVTDIKNNFGKEIQPLSSIGYKEVIDYLDSNISYEFMIENIKKNSRRYAKRQLTWFKNKMPYTKWYNINNDILEIIKDIKIFLESKKI